MHLKFRRVDWDDDTALMHVVFEKDGELLKWYPKWEDLCRAFWDGWLTERKINEDRLTPYFRLMCLNVLTSSLLSESLPDGDEDGLLQDFWHWCRATEFELLFSCGKSENRCSDYGKESHG